MNNPITPPTQHQYTPLQRLLTQELESNQRADDSSSSISQVSAMTTTTEYLTHGNRQDITPSTSAHAVHAVHERKIETAENTEKTKEFLDLITGEKKNDKELTKKKYDAFRNNFVVDPDYPKGEQITPLMLACRRGLYSTASILLKKKVEASTQTTAGCTALHYTLSSIENYEARKKTAILLLNKDPKLINHRDKESNTVAHIAYAAGFDMTQSLLQSLVKRGLITNKENNSQLKPLDIQQNINECNETLENIVTLNDIRESVTREKSNARRITPKGMSPLFCKSDGQLFVEQDTEEFKHLAQLTLEKLEKYKFVQGAKLFGFSNAFTMDSLEMPTESETSTPDKACLTELSDAGSSDQSVCRSSYSCVDYDSVADLRDFDDEEPEATAVASRDSSPVAIASVEDLSITEPDWTEFNQLTKTGNFNPEQQGYAEELQESVRILLSTTAWTYEQALPAIRSAFQHIAEKKEIDNMTNILYKQLEWIINNQNN